MSLLKPQKIVDAAGLFVASLAFWKKPGIQASLDVYEAAEKLLRMPPVSIKTLADAFEKSAHDAIAYLTAEGVVDAEVRIAQMISATLPDDSFIVANRMDPDAVTQAMVARLSAPEHLLPPLPIVFADIIRPVLKEALEGDSFATELNAAYMKRVLNQLDTVQDSVADAKSEMLSKFDLILNGHYVPLETLVSLARIFGGTSLTTRDTLEPFLFERAQRYVLLQARVANLSERAIRAADLKVQVDEHLQIGNLDGVEHLLAEAHELQLKEARDTGEIRADAAMAGGAVEVVHRHFAAISSSFGSVSGDIEARLRIMDYAPRLIEAAHRYDLNATMFAFHLVDGVTNDALRQRDPELWGCAQQALGRVSAIWTTNSGETQAQEYLKQAQQFYENALSVRQRETVPALWAETHLYRAVLLAEVGGTNEDLAMLGDAKSAYRQAYEVFEAHDLPDLHATADFHRADLLISLSLKDPFEPRNIAVRDAVIGMLDQVATRYTNVTAPDMYALILRRKAKAHGAQAMFSDGEFGQHHLNNARDCLMEAVMHYDATAQPVRRMETLLELSAAVMNAASHNPGQNTRARLKDALSILELGEKTLITHPVPDLIELYGMVRKDLETFLAQVEA